VVSFVVVGAGVDAVSVLPGFTFFATVRAALSAMVRTRLAARSARSEAVRSTGIQLLL